jgi:hypothetical protein
MDDQPYHQIRSRTPPERRAEKAAAQVARLQATTKGVNGIDIIKNSHQLNDLEVQRPGGVPVAFQVACTGNLNGLPAKCYLAAFTQPHEI